MKKQLHAALLVSDALPLSRLSPFARGTIKPPSLFSAALARCKTENVIVPLTRGDSRREARARQGEAQTKAARGRSHTIPHIRALLAVVFVLCFATALSAQTITTTSLPVGVIGVAYPPQTLAASGGTTPYTWSVSSGSLPAGLTLSSTTGVISGTPTVSGTFNFVLKVVGAGAGQTGTRSFTITINSPFTVTTALLLDGTYGVSYPVQALRAAGGTAPYSWSLIAGSLPPGISLTSAGVLSGVPTAAGIHEFNVRAVDSSSPPQAATADLIIRIGLAIATSTLPNGVVGVNYSQTLTGSPGVAPYTWYISSGSLPPGVGLSNDGVISGTPGAAGTFNFTVALADSSSPQLYAFKSLSITVILGLTITTNQSLPLAVVSAYYSQTLSTTGTSSVTWSVVSGVGPPGLALTTSGSLFGTPTVAGTFSFTVEARATDPVQTDRRAFQIVVNDALKILTPASLLDATLGRAYSLTLEAGGGVAPYSWITQGRGLPPGLTVSSSGVLSGTPTGVGTFSFTVQVSDSFTPTQQATRTFTLTVATTLDITTTSLPNAIQNIAYSQQFQAVGTGPFTWLVTAGTLPAGLTFSTSGLLQGTPTDVGAQTITVTLTDARGGTVVRDFTITVDPPVPTLSSPGLPVTLNPTQSSEIGLTLATPFPSELKGQLKLAFTSKAEVPVDDPMTQFSSGSRTANFTIPANTTAAVFASKTMLLTGTVAGTVRLTANIDNGPSDLAVATVEVPAIAPQITDVTAVRTGGGLDVQVTGYAPARRVLSVEFGFDIKNGKKTEHQSLTRNVESDFGTWYGNAASTSFGSSFSFLQTFTVQGGDAGNIEGITVRLTNAQGSTSSATVKPK